MHGKILAMSIDKLKVMTRVVFLRFKHYEIHPYIRSVFAISSYEKRFQKLILLTNKISSSRGKKDWHE